MIKTLGDDLRMNHYQYKSKQEQLLKANMNGNDQIQPKKEKDAVMNEVEDNSIFYLIPILKERLVKK